VPSWKPDSETRLRALALTSVHVFLSPLTAAAQAPVVAPEADARAPVRASAPARSPRVVVSAPKDARALLQEALVRAQGELSAVGLGAEIQLQGGAGTRALRLPSDVYGLLELEERGRWLLIRAWAPRARQSVDARVDLSASAVTAEVIAVRAVETLRAAMLEFARSEQGRVPDAVRGFTRFEAGAPVKPAVGKPSTAQAARPLAPPLAFWAGPAVSLHARTSPDLGAQLGVLVGRGLVFGAAAFESTLTDLRLSAAHGSAEVRRQAVWAQVGARFRPGRPWEVATRGGVGYASFAIEGSAEPGYRGISATHGSAAVMLGVSSTYWATRAFGVYSSVGGRLALDAPTIVIADRQVITLDRPSFVISLGVNVGVF
jgi:hypothetical protein